MLSKKWAEPTRLIGRHVVLEPLQLEHAPALEHAVSDGKLWRLWYTQVPAPEQVRAYIETALLACQAGSDAPFVVRDMHETVVGSTRYCRIDAQARRLEIGYTWYAARVQRTALNTEAKLLLLSHAFDALHAVAVEFRTHWFNFRSRAAIERLGAKQDGVLRNHLRMPDGSLRDTVVFSIIESEWPTVKRHLQYRLEDKGMM